MNTAADLVERSVHETLTYYAFPDIHWQKIRTNNPLERIMKKRSGGAPARRRRIPRRPIMPQPGGSSTTLHRWHRIVRQVLHEHETALSAASPANQKPWPDQMCGKNLHATFARCILDTDPCKYYPPAVLS